MNPIEKIEFNKEYVSGPQAQVDFHAGGLFFCVPYEEILVFTEVGKVTISRRTIESFRPGHKEVEQINSFKLDGRYGLNDREYLECDFERYKIVGLPLDENPNMLAFGNERVYQVRKNENTFIKFIKKLSRFVRGD